MLGVLKMTTIYSVIEYFTCSGQVIKEASTATKPVHN